jgi:hypothetical protein
VDITAVLFAPNKSAFRQLRESAAMILQSAIGRFPLQEVLI